MTVRIEPIHGLPEIAEGADLPGLLADALPESAEDGDVLVVTQKAVSKAEGRLVSAPEGRDAWVERETRRVVARRARLVIAETRHGFVCANAGVDESNVPTGFVSLLPEDPDESADRIRDRVRKATGAEIGVVVSDTFGRPWRRGLVNVAIGCAGIPALDDLRGTPDATGRTLEATIVAVADELAAAAGLVMGKAAGIPAALVRGWPRATGVAGTAVELVRPPDEDLFRESPLHAISSRRSIRTFGAGPIPREALLEAVGASLTAPVPHGSRHRSRPWSWTVLEPGPARRRLLAAMADAWRDDLRSDGVAEETIERRIATSDALLGEAPAVAVPALTLAAGDAYPDERRREAEREMFLLATGASVENLMLALHAQGYASCWVSSTLFCKDVVREALGLGPEWLPMGAVAAGPPPGAGPPPRPSLDPGAAARFL